MLKGVAHIRLTPIILAFLTFAAHMHPIKALEPDTFAGFPGGTCRAFACFHLL